MDTSLPTALTQLAKGSLLKLRDAQGHGVAVFCGSLWITQEGDLRDVIAGAGDSVRFDRPGVVVIQALADTRLLRLDRLAPTASRPQPGAAALHGEARQQRSAVIGNLPQRLPALLRRGWSHA